MVLLWVSVVSTSYGQRVVREYRKETGILNTFIIVSEYENGMSRWVTYGICQMCHGSKQCSACYGQGAVYIGSYTGYMPCIACGQTGICHACDSNGLTILGSMFFNQQGDMIGSTATGGNSSESSSGRESKKSTCRHCNGTGYFIQQSSSPGTFIGHSPLYNSPGNKCNICGHYNKHWHLECKH